MVKLAGISGCQSLVGGAINNHLEKYDWLMMVNGG